MGELLTCDDPAGWDAFVSRASDASLLQSWAWGSLKSRHGWKAVTRYLWSESGGTQGGISVLRRPLPGGLSLHYAPRGPVLNGRLDEWPGFWQALRERLGKEGGTILKVDPEWSSPSEAAALEAVGGRPSRLPIQNQATMLVDITGSAAAGRKVKPTYLMHWRAIEDGQRRGCTEYDMWGVPLDPNPEHAGYGYYTFKSRFNGTVVRFVGLYDLPVNRATALTARLVERFVRSGQPEFV